MCTVHNKLTQPFMCYPLAKSTAYVLPFFRALRSFLFKLNLWGFSPGAGLNHSSRFIYLYYLKGPSQGVLHEGVDSSQTDDLFDGFFEMGDAGVVHDVSRKIVPFY